MLYCQSVGSKVFGSDSGLQIEDDRQTGKGQMTDGKHMLISSQWTDDNRRTDNMTPHCNLTWTDHVYNGKRQVKGLTVKQ